MGSSNHYVQHYEARYEARDSPRTQTAGQPPGRAGKMVSERPSGAIGWIRWLPVKMDVYGRYMMIYDDIWYIWYIIYNTINHIYIYIIFYYQHFITLWLWTFHCPPFRRADAKPNGWEMWNEMFWPSQRVVPQNISHIGLFIADMRGS